MRVDICAAEDHAVRDRLLTALASIGAKFEGEEPGIGLNRFRVGDDFLTVFIDAWAVDLAGPDALVRRVLDAMAEID